MIDIFALIAISTAYVLAVVGGLWWIARKMTGREPMRQEEDFVVGDRVQQRSAWRDEPAKHGTVTEVYTATPSGISHGVALYAVLWDGGHTPQRRHMRVGLEREHLTSGVMQNR